MGQSMLNGHLPYTHLWDIKPPLAFAFYACAIALFGKSIVSIRIAGALCITAAAFFTFLLGKNLWGRGTGFLGAVLFIAMSSMGLASGQAVMPEYIALVPMLGALCLLIMRKPTSVVLFFSGALMAIAAMIRLNLAYVSLAGGILAVLVPAAPKPRSFKHILNCALAYIAGNSLIVALAFLPYAATGNGQLWWRAVVLAALSYSGSQLSFLQTFQSQMQYIWACMTDIHSGLFMLCWLVWAGGTAGLAAGFINWKGTPQAKKNGLVLLAVFLAATEISILKGGATYPHYYIQLVPFMALAAAFLVLSISAHARWITAVIVLLVSSISAYTVAPGYKNIISRAAEGLPLEDGAAYEIAAYLKDQNVSGKPIYMMTDQIVYWLTGAKTVSVLAHPSNISKEYLLKIVGGPDDTPGMEMARILAKKPEFIVGDENIWYLRDKPAAQSILANALRTQYELVNVIQGRPVFRRMAENKLP